ncbi:MAG TPA: class I SAM-dependent methyltransferase [Acidimicrobiales bacterium]|nr:class I SAM-dependent methyltransferase [Acidimicrobiales bacterium]
MTTTVPTTTTTLDQRVLEAAIGALELFGIHLGNRLGLYDALLGGAATVGEVATAAGIAPRYAQEWLEQQSVAGVLTVDDVTAGARGRRYTLPDAHIGVVADPLALDHLAPLAGLVVGIASVLDDVVDAYRTGGGVPYARYGAEFRRGQGAINRPAFTSALVEEWLPALGPAVQRLATGGRLADLGCGQGWSTIAVARAFPGAEVWGIDSDRASIEEARTAAEDHGVAVNFRCADATVLAGAGPFDVVVLLEALHDMARPVEALAAARAALAADGVMLVADEAVAPTFSAPGDELERMMYGWSITHCLPAAMAEQPSAAIGTVIREGTVRDLATAAGFAQVDVLDVDGGFFRLYALRP